VAVKSLSSPSVFIPFLFFGSLPLYPSKEPRSYLVRTPPGESRNRSQLTIVPLTAEETTQKTPTPPPSLFCFPTANNNSVSNWNGNRKTRLLVILGKVLVILGKVLVILGKVLVILGKVLVILGKGDVEYGLEQDTSCTH